MIRCRTSNHIQPLSNKSFLLGLNKIYSILLSKNLIVKSINVLVISRNPFTINESNPDIKIQTMKNTKVLISCLAITIICVSSYNYNKSNKHMSPKTSQKHQWMKEYALCKCIIEITQDTLLKNDISLAIYVNIADYQGSKIIEAIDQAAKKAALNITPSQIADYNGKKPYMLSCIQFSQSKQIDSLIKSCDSEFR
jgi:hypothetical protein